MIPTEVPSDSDMHEVGRSELVGRWTILVEISSEFQGAVGAYALLGILFPCILIASAIFGWTSQEQAFWLLLWAAIIFVGCMSISLYTLIWYFWARKRERAIYDLMRKQDRDNDI